MSENSIALTDPLSIGPRLLPCLDLGAGNRVYIEPHQAADDGDWRQTWRYTIEADGEVLLTSTDLASPVIENRSQMVRSAFESLTSFLLAAAESYQANCLEMRADTNTDLFPEDVVVWAYAHDQELGNAAWLLSDAEQEEGR